MPCAKTYSLEIIAIIIFKIVFVLTFFSYFFIIDSFTMNEMTFSNIMLMMKTIINEKYTQLQGFFLFARNKK